MVNLYKILGIPPDADQEAVAAALEALNREWRCLDSHSVAPIAKQARECLGMIGILRTILLDPDLRRAYDQALASDSPLGLPPELEHKDFEILTYSKYLTGVTRVCSQCGCRVDEQLSVCSGCGNPLSPIPRPAPLTWEDHTPLSAPTNYPPPVSCGPPTGALGPPPPPTPTSALPPRPTNYPPPPPAPPPPPLTSFSGGPRPVSAPRPASADIPTQPVPASAVQSGVQFLPAPAFEVPPLFSSSGGPIPSFASQPMPQPAASAPLRRFGRIEYTSPVDKDREYPLRVGLLLERHGRQVLDQARVQWVSLHIPAAEQEPLLRVVPVSTHLRITPAFRDVRLKQGADVFADFRLLADHLPSTPNNECPLQIDFEYNGERIFSKTVPLRIQNQHCLGPIRIPHSYWRLFGAAGGLAMALDTGSSLMQSAGLGDMSLLVQIVVLLLSLAMIGFSLYLWRRSGRRVRI